VLAVRANRGADGYPTAGQRGFRALIAEIEAAISNIEVEAARLVGCVLDAGRVELRRFREITATFQLVVAV
jgi:hypothetical protein